MPTTAPYSPGVCEVRPSQSAFLADLWEVDQVIEEARVRVNFPPDRRVRLLGDQYAVAGKKGDLTCLATQCQPQYVQDKAIRNHTSGLIAHLLCGFTLDKS